jgi:hypothetical protein
VQFSKNQFAFSLFLAFSLLGSVGARVAAAQTSASSTTATSALPGDRIVSLKQLPGNILEDQKDVWLFPGKLVHGEHWWPTIGVLGVTAGLVARIDDRGHRRDKGSRVGATENTVVATEVICCPEGWPSVRISVALFTFLGELCTPGSCASLHQGSSRPAKPVLAVRTFSKQCSTEWVR